MARRVTQDNSTWLGVLLKVNSTGQYGAPALTQSKGAGLRVRTGAQWTVFTCANCAVGRMASDEARVPFLVL